MFHPKAGIFRQRYSAPS